MIMTLLSGKIRQLFKLGDGSQSHLRRAERNGIHPKFSGCICIVLAVVEEQALLRLQPIALNSQETTAPSTSVMNGALST